MGEHGDRGRSDAFVGPPLTAFALAYGLTALVNMEWIP